MLTPLAMVLLMSSATASHAEEHAAILALREANNRAIAARDVDGIMSIAADDYILATSSGRIVRSKAEATEMWTSAGRQCVRTPQSIEIGSIGEQLTAAESGQWRCIRVEGGTVTGPYFAHWRKGSEGWRVTADVYVPLSTQP